MPAKNHPSQDEKASHRDNKGNMNCNNDGRANPDPVEDKLFHSDDMALARLDNYLFMLISVRDIEIFFLHQYLRLFRFF